MTALAHDANVNALKAMIGPDDHDGWARMTGEEPPAEEPDDPRTAARRRRADRYLDRHLDKQRQWYSGRASRYKTWAQWLSLTVLLAGALTGVVQVFHGWAAPEALAIVTGGLSVVVVLAKGLERVGNFEANWLSYRKASERMKREYRLYINGAGPYRHASDEEQAYLMFVEVVEEIISEEQQIFWQSRTAEGEAKGAASETTAGGPKGPGAGATGPGAPS